MIQSLRIENFQSHKDSFLEFSSGISVITGQSNNGKTAVLRALNWVIFNRPQGISFKSTFADKKDSCKVSLIINNQEIIRERNNSVNAYQIGSSLFDKISNDIPSEVNSAINLSEINVQSQFEKHFLLMDSAGEVGRTINKIVKLDDIDALISNISSKITSTNKEIEFKKQDLDKLYLNLEKFKDFDLIESLVNQIIELDIKIKNLEQKVKVLDYIVSESVRIEAIIKNIENKYDDLEEKINELEQSWIAYNTNSALIRVLEYHWVSCMELDKRITISEAILNNAEALKEIENNVIEYATAYEVLKQLNNLKSNWEHYYAIIKKEEKLVEKYETEFKDTLKEIGICPLCERSY